jgi:hypothetical protein
MADIRSAWKIVIRGSKNNRSVEGTDGDEKIILKWSSASFSWFRARHSARILGKVISFCSSVGGRG